MGIKSNPSFKWFNDLPKEGPAEAPFYYSKFDINSVDTRNASDKVLGGRTFNDLPTRAIAIDDMPGRYFWTAQLSLVGYRNGKWESIQSVQYGFSAYYKNVYYHTIFNLGTNAAANQGLLKTAPKP